MQILPIASGKGGVGKSLLAANLAIALARSGKQTILADLDLGGSNLHLILGMRGVRNGIGLFLNSKNADFSDYVLPTDYENLLFIPGDAEIPGIANIGTAQKRKLMGRLRGLEADFLILDLGAGTNNNVMDFFLLSSQGIIITTPTPTALVNAYLCLKNAMFRLLTTSFKRSSPAGELIREITKDGDQLQRIYIPDLVEKIERVDPESIEKYRSRIAAFRPRVVMNMLDDPKDSDKIDRLRRSCKQYLDLDLEHLGVMYRDSLQDIALGARLPIVVYKPNAILSQAICRIADKIIELSFDDSDFLSWTDADESFAAAAAEAEIDFGSKIDYVEELLHTGALSHGDLVETVKTQQLEVNQLRAQNGLLKAKLLKAARDGFDVR